MKRVIQWMAVAGVVLCAGMAQALTLSEIRTQVRRNARDTSATAALQRYSDAQLNDLVNEAQREVINATYALESSTTLSVSSTTVFYSLPTAYLDVIKVTYLKTGATSRTELKEETRRSLIGQNPNWENQTGTPMAYYVRSSTGGMEMAFYPSANSTGGGTAYVDYYIQAADLSGDSDEPFYGLAWLAPYHHALIHYATARLKGMESKWDEAEPYMNMFVGTVNRMKERIGQKSNYNPGFSVGGPGR